MKQLLQYKSVYLICDIIINYYVLAYLLTLKISVGHYSRVYFTYTVLSLSSSLCGGKAGAIMMKLLKSFLRWC